MHYQNILSLQKAEEWLSLTYSYMLVLFKINLNQVQILFGLATLLAKSGAEAGPHTAEIFFNKRTQRGKNFFLFAAAASVPSVIA